MQRNNEDILNRFISSKEIEGCSTRTLNYYRDNIRRILSSFFACLENEDYIVKSPVRRIHKVKTTRKVKETLTDENLEKLRDTCSNVRDLAILELLISTGMRVGEITRLNISDMNFQERSCIVLVEQVHKLLGHIKIDTTMEYAMVNQNNVKNSHRKYIT